ncbi:hypothetical protein B7C42_07439 [Nocardia cerradoensis]|uniref:Uncharacterized protein n=1 Tax=Nocardia cerradoensis TaxID=85688 RepID=A0A231GV43_9NOCA|nr:hypothetical protein [Nocardia cerradoensis]OXR40500.1 hypothetical protein B7C42_07439 [Nocardia cerradoensis]
MNWPTTILCGAAGGLVVEMVAFLANLNVYRQARRRARAAKKIAPSWNRYFDPGPDAAAAVTRLLLGALAGAVLHGQVTTVLAAVAAGAAAPALFTQLGTVQSMRELTELTDQSSE